MDKNRESFSNRFAIVAAAAGSAVGLGNIWKFPYEVGNNGGAAFILIYLFFVILLGFPLMLSEFSIGRMGMANPYRSFVNISSKRRYGLVGVLGVLAAFTILCFYSVVAGWTVEYTFMSITDSFKNKTSGELQSVYDAFVTDSLKPIIFQLIFIFSTSFIVIAGVKNGIERYSKFLMPLLFLIILILCVWSMTLPGASQALNFLFAVDFSKITGKVVVMALGQAFFSLSLGMGILITYGSYMKSNENLVRSVKEVAIIDTLVAVLAGLAIFPAVFSYGIEPTQGPSLVFVALPSIFSQMFGGYLFGIAFFFLLFVAALTSSISLLEVVVSYASEEFKLSRKKSIIIVSILVFTIGALSSLSLGVGAEYFIFGTSFFNCLDIFSTKLLLPIGGCLVSIFVSWRIDKQSFVKSITNNGTVKLPMLNLIVFILKYIAPSAIIVILLNQLGLL